MTHTKDCPCKQCEKARQMAEEIVKEVTAQLTK